VTSSVYTRLHEGIVNGKYPAGESLVETALAAQFGISRTPVREALRRLEQDGLVERGSRGMQVSRRSPEQILEIYEVRIILETAAARSAAEKRTALDLARLEQIHEAMLAASPDDPDNLAVTNRKFHEVLWAMSHNSTLIDLLKRLHSHLVRYPRTTLSYQDRYETVLEDHGELIDAIKSRDSERAASVAERHMTGARNTRLLMYADEEASTDV
jgi:DNA-binding GntR family transcriptional regulator